MLIGRWLVQFQPIPRQVSTGRKASIIRNYNGPKVATSGDGASEAAGSLVEQSASNASARAHCVPTARSRDRVRATGSRGPATVRRNHLRLRSLSVLFLRWKTSSRWRERRLLTGWSPSGDEVQLLRLPRDSFWARVVQQLVLRSLEPATRVQFPPRIRTRVTLERSSCWAPTRPIPAYARVQFPQLRPQCFR